MSRRQPGAVVFGAWLWRGALEGIGVDDLSWAPAGADTSVPNVARVYDALLGGTHNFAVDREIARRALQIEPHARFVARANRALLTRAVRFLAQCGIRQFLDLGSGIPTESNVHEVALTHSQDCRVVYVDYDPVAVAHSRAILSGDDRVSTLCCDIRDPDALLANPALAATLDLGRPVGLLCFYVMHFVTDDEQPARVLGRLRDALAPGSYLALSHVTREGHRNSDADAAEALYRKVSAPIRVRTRAEIAAMFDGFELAAPGLAYLPRWRPDRCADVVPHPEQSWGIAGVGRKR